MKIRFNYRSALATGALCLLTAAVAAQGTLTIEGRDDVPGGSAGVHLIVQAKDSGVQVLQTFDLYWNLSNNGWRSLPSSPLQLPLGTVTLRFTYKNDYCGPNCPNDPDDDRNAYIDSFSWSGVLRQGEDWCRTGGPDPNYPGADREIVDGRRVAVLGNEADWVEYDIGGCDTGGLTIAYGTGCVGTTGIVPLSSSGIPAIGQQLQFNLSNAPPISFVFLKLGLSNTHYAGNPLPASLGPFGAPGCWMYTDSVAHLFGFTNGAGTAAFPWALPNNPTVIGLRVFAQGAVIDPFANPAGVTTTNGLYVRIFAF